MMPQSVQFIFNNVPYLFPSLEDPGIDTIFNRKRERPAIDSNGMQTYLNLCEVMGVAPVYKFYTSLDIKTIDLQLRGVDPRGVRAMAKALESNSVVELLNLGDTWLSTNACHSLGLMLNFNTNLTQLHLAGCRLGNLGLQQLATGLSYNHTLLLLNLRSCSIDDDGITYLTDALHLNQSLHGLDLSCNQLTGVAAHLLGAYLKINTSLTVLDLSWNYLYEPAGLKSFFEDILKNVKLETLNLSWNGFGGGEIGKVLGKYLRKNTAIRQLDLSNNRLNVSDARAMRSGFARSETLTVLKMGRNPVTADGVELITTVITADAPPLLEELDFADVWVEKSFLKILENLKSVRQLKVTIGGVYSDYVVRPPPLSVLLLKRTALEAGRPKNKKLRKDFGHLIWMLGDKPLTQDIFLSLAHKFKAKVRPDLYVQLSTDFALPDGTVNVMEMRRQYLLLFPDSCPAPDTVKSDRKRKRKRKPLKDTKRGTRRV